MSTPPELVKCCKYIDAQKKKYIEELRNIVAISGISGDPNSHDKLSALIEWLEGRLKALGFEVELKEAGNYTPEGSDLTLPIPLLVLGTLKKGANKKTLLYYCHLDVADLLPDSSVTNPFEIVENDGKLYGHGTARMKGPLLCFIHALESYKTLDLEIPINVKIFGESMHEVGNVGMESTLEDTKASFLVGIDCILINDGHWISKKDPCIIYGSRGVCFFDLCVEGPKSNLDSGEYGGILYEPIQDILFIVNTIVDSSGRIKIPRFYDDVVQITPDEEDIYRKLRVDMEDYRKIARLNRLSYDGKAKHTLMNVWRHPTFHLHFIDNEAKSEYPIDLTIPKKVTARFSIRLVPQQNPERVCKLLYRYVEKELSERCTPNNVTLTGNNQLNPWLEDHLHWNYEAAKVAIKQIYKQEPNLIRESNGYPTLLKLRKALPGKNVLVLPLVNNESAGDEKGENISLRCYIENTKLITHYLHNLSVAPRKL